MLDTNDRAEELTGFLRNLFGDRKVSLARATITDRGKTTQTFHEGEGRLRPWSMSIDGMARSMIKKSDAGTEIFYAPTPMSGTKGRKKEQALPNVVVFGDADEGLTADAKAKLIELGACLVRSGGIHPTNGPKYHVYLLLTKEVSPEELEKLNRGLKVFIRGDKFDSTTLLRLPGTRNHKYPKSPLVRVERLADARHTPENLTKFLGVEHAPESPAATKLTLPTVPKGFNWLGPDKGYARVRKSVREWNGRFQSGSCRRYMATIAIVKDSIKAGLTIDEAYGFASVCEPLLDKQEEENGYSIQKDVARTWRRETGMAPSGTLTAEDVAMAPQHEAAKEKTNQTTHPADSIVEPPPKPSTVPEDSPNPYSTRGASRRYLDMAIFTSGNFRPPEPEFFAVDGAFHLLYRGMTHCIFGDSGSGKTWIVLAQIASELKAGRRVKYIDFENGAMTIGHRLRNVLGVPPELLTPDHFAYMSFTEMPDPGEVEDEAAEAHDLVIIDGVDASLAMFQKAMNSATEVREWYDYFPQKYADQGSTVCLIDHTSKGNRDKVEPRHQEPGGTPAKLAVLTGAAYYVKPEDGRELVPGQRGVVNAYITRKDKDGFLKSKARKDGRLFNFIIDTVQGETVVGFETVRQDIPTIDNPDPVTLTAREEEIVQILVSLGRPVSKTKLRTEAKGNSQDTAKIIEDLITRGVIHEEKAARGTLLSPTLNSPEPHTGTRDVDFTKADRMPRGAKRAVECHNCGDHHTYPDDFPMPDDIGYKPGRRWCKMCAEEGIAREPSDGPEWARKVRGRITRSRRTRGDS